MKEKWDFIRVNKEFKEYLDNYIVRSPRDRKAIKKVMPNKKFFQSYGEATKLENLREVLRFPR